MGNVDSKVELGDTQITINPRTIHVGRSIYPVDNLSVFGVGSISKYPMTWQFVVTLTSAGISLWFVVLIVSLISLAGSTAIAGLGVLVLLAIPVAIFSVVIVKISDPQHQGLFLSPNSGDSRLFVTTDLAGVAHITNVVGKILDDGMAPKTSYVVSVTNSDVSGNLLIDSNANDVTSEQSTTTTPPPPTESRASA